MTDSKTENRKLDIRVVMTPEQLKNAREAIELLRDALPVLVDLSKNDRKRLVKMGDKTVEFVNKATDYGTKNEDMVPGYVKIQRQLEDVATVNGFRELRRELQILDEHMEDSEMLAGSRAFRGALGIYATIKNGINSQVTGAKGAYDNLRQRFPGRRVAAQVQEQKSS